MQYSDPLTILAAIESHMELAHNVITGYTLLEKQVYISILGKWG